MLSDRSKSVLASIVVLIVMVLLVLAAEGGIRIRQYMKYGTVHSFNFFDVHEETGLRIPRPGMSTKNIDVNSLGFRGPEIERPKPAGRIRLGFVGGSTTYCAEVSGNDKVWSDLLTTELAQQFPIRSFDYVNGGVPGYDTENSLLNLTARVLPMEPDVLVIYHGTNDLSGETRELADQAGYDHTNLVAEESWLAQHSLLWSLVEKNLTIMSRESPGNSQLLDVDAGTLGDDFRKNLTAMVNEAKAGGVSIVALTTFAIHPREGMSDSELSRAMVSARYYMPFLSADTLLAGFARYNTIIRQVAAETGAVVVESENAIPGTPEYFVDSVHFTDVGSAAQAERILAVLTESEQFLALVGARPDRKIEKHAMSAR